MSDPITQSMMQGAAGASGDAPQWVDEVFDIQTYKGTGTTNKRTSSVDNTKGGMLMWSPRTGGGANRYLYDTVRGKNMSLYPDSTSAGDNRSGSPDLASFDNNGYTLMNNNINYTGYTSVIWNWRKAPGFFDCFEYTGTGVDNNIQNHKLKALPGLIIVKRTDAAGDWVTVCGPWIGYTEYTFGSSGTQFAWNNNNLTYNVKAFAQIATANTVNVSHLQEISSGTWDVAAADTNASGATYMCYMWAMGSNDGTTDAAIYGENQDQTIISCGVYQGDGGSNHMISTGWEPQFVMYRSVFSGSDDWQIYDSQRGVRAEYGDQRMTVNSSGNESSQTDFIDFERDGWRIKTNNDEVNNGSRRYFYMAIRRPEGYVGKPAEAGTDVFAMDYGSATTPGELPTFDSPFPVDLGIMRKPATSESWYTVPRVAMGQYLELNNPNAENSYSGFNMDSNVGWAHNPSYDSAYLSWMWKRHAGFDVVSYAGNGSSNRQVNHSLGRTPEMMWLKARNWSSGKWNVYHKDVNGGVNPANWYILITGDAPGQYGPIWNNTLPTATNFTVGNYNEVNSSSYDYIMYLFASVEGICKVGSYTGTGASGNSVTTGFQPRLLIIKRADAGAPWYVFDSKRGFGSGNDQILYLNLNSAQNGPHTAINPTSTGFTIQETWNDINDSGGKYLYYAHA